MTVLIGPRDNAQGQTGFRTKKVSNRRIRRKCLCVQRFDPVILGIQAKNLFRAGKVFGNGHPIQRDTAIFGGDHRIQNFGFGNRAVFNQNLAKRTTLPPAFFCNVGPR